MKMGLVLRLQRKANILMSLITINMTGATSRAGSAYPSGAPKFIRILVGFVLLDL